MSKVLRPLLTHTRVLLVHHPLNMLIVSGIFGHQTGQDLTNILLAPPRPRRESVDPRTMSSSYITPFIRELDPRWPRNQGK